MDWWTWLLTNYFKCPRFANKGGGEGGYLQLYSVVITFITSGENCELQILFWQIPSQP